MNLEKFEKRIKKELKKINKVQAVHFAWLCAIRALPFLGANGNFDFWNKEERQKHIYAVFFALDVNTAARAKKVAVASRAAVRAEAAASDAANAAYAAASAADVVADAAYAAASAADATAVVYSIAYSARFVANAAVNAAIATASIVAKYNINFELLIIQDLKSLQGEKKENSSTDLYGNIWDNFQKALYNEGCGFWGKLYQSIFDNGFRLDWKALERRMNVPKEKREQGASAVANFLEEIGKKGIARLNEARIIILGEKGAGKTCIARKLINPDAPMTADNESTAGVDTTLWKLEKENFNVRIWDFAGHTVTHAVHQFFLSERCLYLIVYDGRTEARNRLEYWLDHMKNYGGDSSAFILVNKRDNFSVDIPINSLKEQYSIGGVYTFSIKEDEKDLEAFRSIVAEYIKNNPSWEKQEIPVSYYKVKEELEKLFVKGENKKGREHITKEEFVEIASKHDVDNIDELLTDLHFLGVSLWYKDMQEYNTLILNPEWISHGVYKVINWVNEERKYSITLDEFKEVFQEDAERYPSEKHEFIFNLMKHYELAYETDTNDYLIIPHLLKEDRPEMLPVFPVGVSLMLLYESEQQLPPDTISRFIVRHNKEIQTENSEYVVWRRGVVLEDGKGSLALVREEDRTISVWVKGKEKTKYISALRETLNEIFNSYKSKKPKLKYRIQRFGEIPDSIDSKDSLWLTDSKIINHYKREKPFYDDESNMDIPLAETVNIYNIKADTAVLGSEHQFTIDKSKHTTFNFKDCNINLQGNINELAQLLTESGNIKEAKELENTASALGQVERLKSKETIKKRGIAGRLKRLIEEIGDEDSKLHKTVKGIKHGIGIAQDIAKGYNDIAQWVGLPQVPKPFLKKSNDN